MIGQGSIKAALLCAILVGTAASATAQDQPGVTAEQAIVREKEVFGPPAARPRCSGGSTADEIVVCAPENSDQFRVQSTAESDPNSRAAKRLLDDGIPRAPQVGTVIDCSNGGCIGFGSVPPPAYFIDYAALPEPPAGSDADRISKGELRAP